MTEQASQWEVAFTPNALEFMDEHVSNAEDAKKIFKYRELLKLFPEFGRVYNPDYPAAIPSFTCRYIPIPDTHFTLFYTLLTEARTVAIFALDFQMANPNTRFSGIEYSLIPWISD